MLFLFAVLGVVLTVWRFAVGLGPSTGLIDGYPWGIWIAFDVVTGTALGCGGYAIAFLVYILNKGKYHPLVRPALLTSALGYTMAAVAIVIDVGRPWLIWRIPISVGKWNLNSALLEVALCVMAYMVVLWIELSPGVPGEVEAEPAPGLAELARHGLDRHDKVLIWIIALGLLLPTMHQSSLGTVILLAGHRLHPLWHTPWLPLLFLISCIAMGYAIVVIESTLSSRAFGRAREDRMLASLSRTMIVVLLAYVVIRLADIVVARQDGAAVLLGPPERALLAGDGLLPGAGGGVPGARPARSPSAACSARPLTVLVGGALYRFDSYLVAFTPGRRLELLPQRARAADHRRARLAGDLRLHRPGRRRSRS